MPSIKKASTLLKRISLINYISNFPGLNITPLLVGPHGIGKSMIAKNSATELGGYVATIEASALKEGEVTGLPFANVLADGTSEVRFIKYFQINKIYQLEKYYYNKACNEGFLGGTLKIEKAENGTENTVLIDGNNKTIISSRDIIDRIEAGEDNIYKFAENLPGDLKLKLLESGEIKPFILFFDEINRTDPMTTKELMNIILNKTVNGYSFPWWVSICAAINPSSQNSSYSTSEMDDAQNDRFLRIKVDANLDEWIDYALASHLNSDIIEALAVVEGIFQHKESGYEDKTEMTPSPRSWHMCSLIYDHIFDLNNSKYFDESEKKTVDDDLRILLRGKVGDNAARTLLETIARKENNIKPAEIITMKSKKIDPAIVDKFNRQKRLTQKIIADNVLNYIFNTITDVKKLKTSTVKDKKEQYTNYMSQIKEFINMLDTATQLILCKKMATPPYRQKVFMEISTVFADEVLANIYDAKASITDLANN